jgi:transcriptional regulator with XRE-family HTH domain
MKRTQLIDARLAKGWSQERAAGEVGVGRNTYGLWELGKVTPYPLYRYRLCEVFGRSEQELGFARESEEEMDVSRRQLIASGVGLAAMTVAGPMIAMEEFLPQCSSSLQVCRQLLQGSKLSSAEQMLNAYVPTLSRLVLLPSKYQETLASLATHAKMLQALCESHKMNLVSREAYCHEAVQYSDLSGDSGLITAAKMNLGHCHIGTQRPKKAIAAYLEALHALGDDVSLLRSHVYMGLACAYAQQREEQQALEAIGLAAEHFPDRPEFDPHASYADADKALLHLWEGKMYLALLRHSPDSGHSRNAITSLTESAKRGALSDRVISEMAIHHAEAALGMGDMEEYVVYLRDGAMRGLAIGSQKRYSEAFAVFKRTPASWRNEPAIRALKDDVFYQSRGFSTNSQK